MNNNTFICCIYINNSLNENSLFIEYSNDSLSKNSSFVESINLFCWLLQHLINHRKLNCSSVLC